MYSIQVSLTVQIVIEGGDRCVLGDDHVEDFRLPTVGIIPFSNFDFSSSVRLDFDRDP